MNKDLVLLATAEIEIYLTDLAEARGPFDYYGYLKTNPESSSGFEEHDCKVVLPGLDTRRVRFSNDPDEVLCREITDTVLSICSEVIKDDPYTRIIVTKNGSLSVEIGK